MQYVTNFGSQLAAALSALALSVVLISGTVSVPVTAPHAAQSAHLASAYVGALA